MSKPRATMSVATSTRTSPLLKPSSALTRAPCDLLPWIAAPTMSSRSSCLTKRLAPCFVRLNTNTCCQSLVRIKWLSNAVLRVLSTA